MAWNTPGGNDSGERPTRRTWQRGNGGSGGGWRPQWPAFGGNARLWVLGALGLWLLFNCFVLIAEQDRGVVLRFGQYARTMQPGPNFKLPWPIESVIKVPTTQVRTYSNTVPVLTADENIVNVSFNVQYRVGDPRQFVFGTRDADKVLEQTAISTVREQIGRSTLDTALNTRGPLSSAAATALQASLDDYRTGLVVTEVNLQDARPPEEVKPAFDEVNSAQQMNERLVNEARAYAAKVVPEARGEAARVRTVAEGYKTSVIARATGDSQRFNLMVDEYRNAPEVTRKRLWLETVQSVLANNRKVVGGDGRQLIYVPMPQAGEAAGAQAAPAVPPAAVAPIMEAQPETVVRPGREARGGRENTR